MKNLENSVKKTIEKKIHEENEDDNDDDNNNDGLMIPCVESLKKILTQPKL